MNQNEYQPPSGQDVPPDQSQDTIDRENVSPGGIGIGGILRNEREKKALSYARISEMTKLRPHILEALENEDWDQLPSPVFVTGFVRTYARALELEEGKVVDLYHKAIPPDTTIPKPLMEPVKSRRSLSVFLIFLLLTMASAYYLWNEYPGRERVFAKPETIVPAADRIVKLESILETPDVHEQLVPEEIGEPGPAAETEKEVVYKEPRKGSVREKKKTKPVIKKPVPYDYDINPEIEDFPFTLTANVREKTWIRISVDGDQSREYIFIPGNSREWKARVGFELLIGNADGIDFEFNGEKINNLGRSGQVVHFFLPEYYIRQNSRF